MVEAVLAVPGGLERELTHVFVGVSVVVKSAGLKFIGKKRDISLLHIPLGRQCTTVILEIHDL